MEKAPTSQYSKIMRSRPTNSTPKPGRGVLALLLIFAWATLAHGQDPEVLIGFDSMAKLGHWGPVTFKFESQPTATQWRITTLDGDDTPVTTSGPLWQISENGLNQHAMVQFGRTYGQLDIELLDNADKVIFSDQMTLSRKPTSRLELVPSTAPMVLCIEPQRDSSISKRLKAKFPDNGPDDRARLVVAHQTDQLPVTRDAWSCFETVFLLADDPSFAGEIPADVLDSLAAWVRRGGRLMIASSPQAIDVIQGSPKLSALFPGTIAGPATLESSRRIEDFSGSGEQLIRGDESLSIIGMSDTAGARIALQQGGLPLVIRASLGLGEVTLITVNPQEDAFLNWEGNSRFIFEVLKLGHDDREREQGSEIRTGSAVRHSGYRDLVGQLKVPLESFSALSFIPFTAVAVLIALYIVCIGVGDRFLVSKLLKRHELTWLTFPLMALSFCALAWFIAHSNRPTDIQVNQLEVVDIDSVSGDIRGTVWANLYSPQSAEVDLSTSQTGLRQEIGDVSHRVSWLGLPGDGLGGLRNRANPGIYRSGYEQPFSADATKISMNSVQMQVSSTKPIFVEWDGRLGARVNSRLSVDQRLKGTFTNPFDVPLKNCKLYFEDWVYIVRGTLAPGDTVDVISETLEKSAKSHLTRRKMADSKKSELKSQTIPWDPENADMSRIAQMMLFHNSCGGKSYTNMTHGYHEFVDMTSNLSLNRAVLVGRLVDRVSEIGIDGNPAEDLYDQSLTLVRVVLPVERKSKK